MDASDIEVSVKDGRVYLRGTVDSRNAKRESESCLDSLLGIEDIQNELRVKSASEQLSQSGSSEGALGH